MQDVALILFVRNPQIGKVKTRLAKTIGDYKALKIYEILLGHTLQITSALKCEKFVYYADIIAENDMWSQPGYIKHLQTGNDLGERMSDAFKAVFEQGFKKALIIGSDCYQLTGIIIQEAIQSLNTHQTVIGPTVDGGYYLLGMVSFIPELFLGKEWSTGSVASETIKNLYDLGLKFKLLKQLYDVDEAKDLEPNGILI